MRLALLGTAAVMLAQAACAEDGVNVVSLVGRAPIQVITLTENGVKTGIALGKCIDVRLRTNPSTGYDWYMTHDSTALMKLESRTLTTPGNAPPGAPSEVDFILCAVEKGEGVVKFAYYRPWENNTPPAETLAVTVKITE